MVEVGDSLWEFGDLKFELKEGMVSLAELHSNEPLVLCFLRHLG